MSPLVVGTLVAFSLSLVFFMRWELARRKSRELTDRQVVYDKAEHHLLDEGSRNQEGFNEYIYGGIYLGWLIDSGLHSPEFFKGKESLLEEFRARKVTVSELYGTSGEALISDMLSEKGNRFTAHYFESGYPQDYEELLAPGEMGYEFVADTWENYARIRSRLDDRYRLWSEM
ncbi:MAG TPA: hypothetical protein VK539_35750 [Myxococcaceae bacterium]|nr:hypothetical protein [Myxococcaceae bacterium]